MRRPGPPRGRGLALALLLAAADADAQGTPDAQVLGRVLVTGSRLPRIDAETALPVQIVRRAEIEQSGASNAEELLDRISANFGGYREALGAGDQNTPGFSGASLRGFGAGETLVLLNGRRIGNYAFTGVAGPGVDLHVIPLAAIDRVEILKDGASALYGSDAIAGVINFVTRKDFAGGAFDGHLAATEQGGGDRARATLALGHGSLESDGYNLFGVVDAQISQRLRATERSFADTAYRTEIGLNSASVNSFPANIRRFVGGRPTLINPAAPACTADTVYIGTGCFYDYAKAIDILPPSRQLGLLGRGTVRVGEESEAYAELLASTDRVVFRIAPAPASPSTAQTGVRFVLPTTSPYYPQNLGLSGPLSLTFRTVSLGPRTSEVESDHVRVLAGLKSRAAGWDLDGSLLADDSRARARYTSGQVDAGKLAAAIGSGLVNPFGASGPEGNALLGGAELRGDARSSVGRLYAGDLKASRDLIELPAGPLGVALGLEARRETLVDRQTALVADVIGGAPAAPKEGARNVGAGYAELVVPVWKGVELQAAARVDHYSDFGTATSPKLALRVQPAAGWLVRASGGRGFRAPSLPELFTQQQTSVFELAGLEAADPLRCPVTGLDTDCFPVVDLRTGGNPALKPQRSTQLSAGLVIDPAAGWLASVDAWSIRVRDLIGTLDLATVAGDLARFGGRNVVRGPVDPATPNLPGPIVRIDLLNENLGQRRIDGVDLAFALRPTSTPLGNVSARFDGTYVHRARQELVEGDPVELIGRIAPRWNHTLSAMLERSAWSATLTNRYRRGYDDVLPLPDGGVHRVSPQITWDGRLALAIGRDLKLAFGVRNLFDAKPPVSNQGEQFQVGYDPLYADPRGRTWTFGLGASWR